MHYNQPSFSGLLKCEVSNVLLIADFFGFQMVNIRKLLTEVLLTVTNEELKKIAQETYNEALRGTYPVMLSGVLYQVLLVGHQ